MFLSFRLIPTRASPWALLIVLWRTWSTEEIVSRFQTRYLRCTSSRIIHGKFGVGILVGLVVVLFAGGILAVAAGGNRFIPRYEEFPDADGALANLNLGRPTDTTTNPFFQPMGTNGRSCVTCHQPSDAFSVTPRHIRQRFEATRGTDPIFRPVDGANCPMADVSTMEERREACSLLLSKGSFASASPFRKTRTTESSPSTTRTDAMQPMSFPCTGVRCRPRIFAS
jgi:hypothetical protein